MEIRRIKDSDFDHIWPFFRDIIRARETYAFNSEMNRDKAYELWVKKPLATFVAVQKDSILGTYYIKPNADGPGSHICNCGYMVSKDARGEGVARKMCFHSQKSASEMGFKAMQFNSVVKTNEGAVALWKKMGFEIIGTIPKAFDHKKSSLVDAYIMYKWLDSEDNKNWDIKITSIEKAYDSYIRNLLLEHWGSSKVVTREKILDAAVLPGYIAFFGGQPKGLITYEIKKEFCEIVTLNSELKCKGIGSALIDAVVAEAAGKNCSKVWLITTNDNINAIGFYQKRGFSIAAVHCNAIEKSRAIKPIIPLIGLNGIPIRDEFEFEKLI